MYFIDSKWYLKCIMMKESDGSHPKPSEVIERFSESNIEVVQNKEDNKLIIRWQFFKRQSNE